MMTEDRSSQPIFRADPQELETIQYRPVRISGFFALGLGLLSAVSFFADAMRLIPLLAFGCALFALRPSQQGVPIGSRCAIAGLILAVFFGIGNWTQAEFRNRTFGQQGIHFATQWIESIQQGHLELGCELSKEFFQRQSEKVPLKPYYANNLTAQTSLDTFKSNPVVADLIHHTAARWVPDQSPEISIAELGHRIHVIFRDATESIVHPLEIDLIRVVENNRPISQWHVEQFQYRKTP